MKFILFILSSIFVLNTFASNVIDYNNQIDSLIELSITEFNSKNTEQAIAKTQEVLSIINKEDIRYQRCITNLSAYYSSMGKIQEAHNLIRLLNKTNNYNFFCVDIFSNIAHSLYNSQRYDAAITCADSAIAITEKDSILPFSFLTTLSIKSKSNYKLGYLDKAIKGAFNLIKILNKNNLTEDSLFLSSMNMLTDIYRSLDDSSNIFFQDSSHIYILNNISRYHSFINDYKTAIQLDSLGLNILKKRFPNKNDLYSTTLYNLGMNHYKSNQYHKSINILEDLLQFQKTHNIPLSIQNMTTELLGDNYFEIGILEDALKFYELTNQNNPILEDSTRVLSNIAMTYSELGNYAEAQKLHIEVLKIIEQNYSKNHPDYANALNSFALHYTYLGNYTEAQKLYIEALKLTEKTSSKNHPNYATTLNNLAKNYFKLGNYTEALKLHTEALKIIDLNYGKNYPYYALILKDLAENYSMLGNDAEAHKLFIELLSIAKKVYGKNPLDYANTLNSLALHYTDSGNYTEAQKLYIEALKITKNIFDKNSPNYITILINLARNYFNLGNYIEAVKLYTQAFNITKNFYDNNHPTYVASLGNLAFMYLTYNHNEYSKYANEYINLSTSNICNAFTNLSQKERAQYWNKHKFWHTNMIHQGVLKFNDSSLFPIAYNSVLFSKGLLLNAEIAMRDLLSESNDTLSLKVFDELYSTQRILNKQYEILPEQRCFSIDSLENRSQELEQQLISISKVYGDYTHNLQLRWTDVQSKLLNDDIAIEFVSFSHKDSITYLAYLLKKDFDAPIYKKLITHHKNQIINNDNIYNSTHFSKLIWSKLSNELKGVKNIYFAPSGELYNIAIESLPYWEDSTILVSDKWNLYRLSSTRELALNKTLSKSSGAVVYGGLKYDAELNQLDIINNTQREFFPYNNTINKDSINMRHGVAYLPGTYDEAISIDKMLKKNHINDILYIGEKGTETTLKTFGGRSPKILHIATHGFYWTQREARRMDFSFLNKNNRNIEDKMLSRSGLLFSGANNILSGKEIPNNIDDGILTAEEISKIDLRGLDLLVLSACQTGLGEISGEGVFGLQRGFKKAGAQSILMSLWKVDDHATQLFMTQFYKSFLNNKNKRQAYLEALHFVKNYNLNLSEFSTTEIEDLRKDGAIIDLNTNKIKPYANPKYWAAFILLDAI